MIKYAIPGMYELRQLNFNLLYLLQNNPEYFYDNIQIEIAYGNPQFCIWDGGRIFTEYNHATLEEIESTIYKYNNIYNIPIRYVFTNPVLKEEHFEDRFCNKIMEIGNYYHNEVVCNNDKLMSFLKNKYDNYKFVSSTTKCILNKEELFNEFDKEDYKLVCLDYNFNSNIEFLNSFTEEQKEKTELLINAICPPGCQYRKEHYKLNGLSHLNYGKHYKMRHCGINNGEVSLNVKNYVNNLSYENITQNYEPIGFKHFKLEGRTWNELSLALTYTYYMVKPEYRDEVMVRLLEEVH